MSMQYTYLTILEKIVLVELCEQLCTIDQNKQKTLSGNLS